MDIADSYKELPTFLQIDHPAIGLVLTYYCSIPVLRLGQQASLK